ncbi:MAG: cation:proton antiporter [Alphaproteobacteria bacterium]|nr:cation:proton antiporter [Alphaproteobacteria bacterium]
MSAVLAATAFTAIVAGVAILAVAARLLRGPSSADRAIAIDMLGLLAIVVATLVAVIAGQQGFLDVAFGIALVAFLGAVAFAGLLERLGAAVSDAAPPAPAAAREDTP